MGPGLPMLFMLIGLAAFIAVIALASPERRLGRKAFGLRFLGLVAAFVLLYAVETRLLSGAGGPGSGPGAMQEMMAVMMVFAVINFALGLLQAYWSVARAQDAGRSKWWCLLLLVPFVNLAFLGYLLFAPTKAPAAPAPAEAEGAAAAAGDTP